LRPEGARIEDEATVELQAARDRFADLIGDRSARAWARSEGAQADELIGVDDRLERSCAAGAQVAGMLSRIAVAPDARPAGEALEVGAMPLPFVDSVP
jgi:hypothetical protein